MAKRAENENVFGVKVKPVYNDHPRDRPEVVVIDRWTPWKGGIQSNLSFTTTHRDRPEVVVIRQLAPMEKGNT